MHGAAPQGCQSSWLLGPSPRDPERRACSCSQGDHTNRVGSLWARRGARKGVAGRPLTWAEHCLAGITRGAHDVPIVARLRSECVSGWVFDPEIGPPGARIAALAVQDRPLNRPEACPCAGEAEWRGWESNPRHHDFQSCALPTELPRRSRAGWKASGESLGWGRDLAASSDRGRRRFGGRGGSGLRRVGDGSASAGVSRDRQDWRRRVDGGGRLLRGRGRPAPAESRGTRRSALDWARSVAGARGAAMGAADVPAVAAGAAGADRTGAGAVIAGAREGWAYVWPRDAGAVALAFAAAGYRVEARRVARFLLRLDLDAAARFHPDGTPVEGREAQGDAQGWVEVAAHAARVNEIDYPYGGRSHSPQALGPIAPTTRRKTAATTSATRSRRVSAPLASETSSPASGNCGATRRTPTLESTRPPLGRCGRSLTPPYSPPCGVPFAGWWMPRSGRFGIVPSENWPEEDPWTAPTAWTAWAFAALGDRTTALELMSDLRRAATPLGLLPERVDAQSGEPRSTTPLAWSHAFAILALRELWP